MQSEKKNFDFSKKNPERIGKFLDFLFYFFGFFLMKCVKSIECCICEESVAHCG